MDYDQKRSGELSMRISKKIFLRILIVISFIFGCSDEDEAFNNLDESIESDISANQINEFIWFAMNTYYYWVDEDTILSSDTYPTLDDLYSYLDQFSSPEDFF